MLSLLIVIKHFLKEIAYKGDYTIGSFNPPEQNLPVEKCYTDEWDCFYVMKKMGLKVGCFAGFSDHRLTTMSAHTHVYAILCMKM